MEHGVACIVAHFPDLTTEQMDKLEALAPLYADWNGRLNLISRKDIGNLYPHHVLHSLAIAKQIAFQPKSHILDLGTGGGLPGLPLAILFPQAHFVLLDSIRKKIGAVDAMVKALDLHNVTTRILRAEDLEEQFDFVIARAITHPARIWRWSAPLMKQETMHPLPNGLLYLTGTPDVAEMRGLLYEQYKISDHFDLPYFNHKVLLHIHS